MKRRVAWSVFFGTVLYYYVARKFQNVLHKIKTLARTKISVHLYLAINTLRTPKNTTAGRHGILG